YTWWSYMQQARDKNIGWRIDYFLCSHPLKTRLKDALIYKDILGSDHCPVGLELV
ncbi:endonuclease/exonuclease/phosphatase family protein, partial [Helicobacter pylori]